MTAFGLTHSDGGDSTISKGAVIGAAAGPLLLMALVFAFLWWRRPGWFLRVKRRLRSRPGKESGEDLIQSIKPELAGNSKQFPELVGKERFELDSAEQYRSHLSGRLELAPSGISELRSNNQAELDSQARAELDTTSRYELG